MSIKEVEKNVLEIVKRVVKRAVIRALLSREDREASFVELGPNFWGCDTAADGILRIDGVAVTELTEKYGTPLHVVNKGELIRSYRNFRKAFSHIGFDVTLATSYKTNPVPNVLATLHREGSFADVISHFELWLALRLNVPPSRIVLNGPGKGDEALRLAVLENIGAINIDGPGEIAKIARYAKDAGKRQRVGIRVVTSVGWSSQFGFDIASGAAAAAYDEAAKHPELDVSAVHLHLGSGVQDVTTYVKAVGEVCEFAEFLFRKYGIRIDHFDLGGGFGVPTVRTLDEWDLRMQSLGYSPRYANPARMPRIEDFANGLKPLLERLRAFLTSNGAQPKLILEPGRAITSSCQTLLLSVIGRKPGLDGKQKVFVDGGKNVTMPLGWETHYAYVANKMNRGGLSKYDVFGPLCHPGDVVLKNTSLPSIEEGDIVAIMDAGAYFIPNQTNFSNPRPAVVEVNSGRHSLVRERERFEDIVRLDGMSSNR